MREREPSFSSINLLSPSHWNFLINRSRRSFSVAVWTDSRSFGHGILGDVEPGTKGCRRVICEALENPSSKHLANLFGKQTVL